MGVIAKYKFNQTIYENFIPTFNSEFTDYIITDETDTDGYTIRTIESDSLPTQMKFGTEGTKSNRELSLLEVIDINTTNITNMYFMFRFCNNVTSICTEKFNTDKVNTMSCLFDGCTSLTSINASSFNTKNVTNMAKMFEGCSSLTSLDLSNFNTEKVTTMQSMFSNCSSLTSLDVSNFNTEKVSSMSLMFNNCKSLISLDASSFNTEKVTNMSLMFYNCSSLISLNVSNFNTKSVTTMQNIFYNCSSLALLDVSNFSIENVINVQGMFVNCKPLTNIGTIHCNSSTINKISEAISTNTTIWYQDANPSDLTQLDNITYKKYQSTILSLNEPIQLRSIGDVYDEINYETGEYIQRIGEMVLDGSEDERWHTDSSTTLNAKFKTNILGNVGSNETIADKVVSDNSWDVYNQANGNEVLFLSTKAGLHLSVLKTNAQTVDELKLYLQSNPITVQYQLAQPIITKIDTTILDQNNSYKSSQQTYDEQTYVSVQSDTVVTPTSSVDYEIYSSTGTITGTSATIENAEAGTPVSGVVYGETLLNVIQEPSEDEYVIIGDNFEGQSGTLENTVEGNIKSAILKGQTLVSIYDGYNPINQMSTELFFNVSQELKENTKYMILSYDFLFTTGGYRQNTWKDIIDTHTELTNKFIFTTSSPVDFKHGYLNGTIELTSDEKKDAKIVLLEYQDGMENWDIPYFEGMQSVNLYPNQTVLTTTGKNLFDASLIPYGGSEYNDFGKPYATSIKPIFRLKPNTTYYIYGEIMQIPNHNSAFKFVDSDEVEIQGTYVAMNNSNGSNYKSFIINNKFTTKTNGDVYFNTFPAYTQEDLDKLKSTLLTSQIQIEEGSVATEYEPYKSNILTVNEEVHLHRIGDVQDTLDLMTGEVTKRIGEVVLDGSQDGGYDYATNESTGILTLRLPKIPDIINTGGNILGLLSDKYASVTNKNPNNILSYNGSIMITKPISELESFNTADKIKSFLSQNPITVQYPLATPIIKTVGLSILDQDDKPTDNLHTFDTITHINTYAQGGGLMPFVNIPENISYDTMLKANTQYTIKLNRTNIVEGTPLTVNLGGTELSIEDSADSFTITTPSTLTNNTLSISGANNKVKEVMVIEGDYVDRDLDFFEGFISVENPTIYTVGKNKCFVNDFPKLYPKYFELREGRVYGKAEYAWESTGIHMAFNFKQNTSYTISYDKEEIVEPNGDRSHNVVCIYTDGTKTSRQLSDKASIITDGNKTIDAIYLCNPWKVGGYMDNIQIEEGTTRTSYEPYQGNTLTTYPQITLRSMGDIKDEWDVVGETVTRRIGEIVLDGSEEIHTTNNGKNINKIVFKEKIYYQASSGDDCNYLMCDKLRCVKYSNYAGRLYDFISIGDSGMTNYGSAIYIKFNSATTVDEWKDLYSQITPITLHYQLETPITESVRITPPNPQTSTASITIPTQLNHIEDTSDFLVWNPYKEHYVRYNYVEDGVILDNYTWENLTDSNERQFVEFYNKRTYIDQPYHNYVASHDSKGTSKYVLIEPNQDYTVSVRFSELPTCETVKVNLGGTEVEMNVNDPHVHITTPNTLANNLCSISGDGLDGKITDILVIHCLEHEGFADIDYFEGIDGIGEIVDNKVSIIMEQTNGNLIDVDGKIYDNGNGTQFLYIKIRPNKSYNVKTLFNTNYYLMDKNDAVSTRGSFNNGSATFTSNEMEEKLSLYCTVSTNGSSHTHIPIELSYADMEKDYIRPRYNNTQEIILPMQLHRINTVYDNFYYDEMKGFYRIQQSIGHKYFVGADSENWTLIERGQRVLRFRYNNADIQIKSLGEYMTNLLPNGTASSPYESCTFNGTTFIVSIDKERLSSESLTAFKEWLANNNLHLYYQLASPLMIDLPEYSSRIEFNTYKDEIYTFFKNCKPTVFTLGVPLDKTYRFYEYEESQGYANRVELTDERMTDEDTLYIDTIHGSGFSNLIENPNNVETLLKPNYQGKAVSHTLTNGKVSSIKVHGFEPNETTIANYNSTLKQYELIVQAQKGQNINTQTLAVPYKLEVYEDGTKDRVYYDEQNKLFRFEGGSVTNPPYNNSYIFNTPLEVFKGIAPRTGLIAEIKVKFNSGTTSARIYYSLDGGATTAYSTLRSMTDEVEYYIGFFNTGGTKLDYATKLSAEAEYINLAPLSSTLPESLIITQIQNISECTFTLDKTYYFDSWIKPLELDVYNGETIITEQSGAIVTINNNGLHKDALTYTDETYTVYWTYVGGEGNVTITLGGTKVEVVGTQGYATLKTAIDGVQDGLIIGGYNLSIKDLMLVKGERIEDLAYFEGSRAVGTAFVDENGETKYKITLVTGSELINDKFENRITFEDNNKHNVVVTKLLGNKPNKK